MKKSVLLLSIVVLSGCMAPKLVSMSETSNELIVDVEGSKNNLYLRANEWMVDTFNNPESVIQFQDKDEGAIMGKYLLFSNKSTGIYGIESGVEIFATIKILVKDNATKISIEPLTKTWYYDSSGISVYKYSPENAQDDINKLMASYSDYMKAKEEVW
jgi:PBP1b-binding outer membrane lipoprotein LpoB